MLIQYQPLDETRLVTYYTKIQGQISSQTLEGCRKVGLSVTGKLNNLFVYADWEIKLIREVKAQLGLQFMVSLFGKMTTGDETEHLKQFAAIMETLKGAKRDLLGTIQEKQEEKKRQIESLKALLHELVDESEGKFRRYPPLS